MWLIFRHVNISLGFHSIFGFPSSIAILTKRPGYTREEALGSLFLMGPSNALELMEKLRKQDGGAHGFASSLVYPSLYPYHA